MDKTTVDEFERACKAINQAMREDKEIKESKIAPKKLPETSKERFEIEL